MIYQNYKKFLKNNNENTISKKEEINDENPVVQSDINDNFNNESNIIKGLLDNMKDEENNMELEKDNEEDNDNKNKNDEDDDDNQMENEEEKMDNNEEEKIEPNIDDKTKFKTFLINLLKNNNFLQQRAVKMTITNFLELLNLFNNNGIHFN